MDFSSLFSRLIFTLFVYFLVPIIIIISQKQFTKKKLRMIMIFNGVGGFLLFSVLYVLSGIDEVASIYPAFIWSSIGFAILKKTSCLDGENCSEDVSKQSEMGRNVPGTNVDIPTTEKNTLIYVVGEGVPAGKHVFIATNDIGGIVQIFSSDNTLLDRLYVKKKEKIKLKTGNIVKTQNCIIVGNDIVKNHEYEVNNPPANMNYTPTESPSISSEIRFCRKCGNPLLPGALFCNKCGIKITLESSNEAIAQEPTIINLIEKLARLTVTLPSFIAESSKEKLNFSKNIYTYCDAIIFTEFFIRANALKLAPSQDIAIKLSDEYITAVINCTIELLPESKDFFVDMFYSRATLYDNIVLYSTEPVQEVVEVLSHIIHKEVDEEEYIDVTDKNFRYFGGVFENLSIKTELVGLFQSINKYTKDEMEEITKHFKNS